MSRKRVLHFSGFQKQADGRTHTYASNIRRIFVALFQELPQTVPQWMYIAVDCCLHRDTVPVLFSVLTHSTFTVQTVQSATELYLQ